MLKKIIKIISFSAIMILIFLECNTVLEFKYGDGIKPLRVLAEQQNDSIDVLIVGSSHAFIGINPAILWKNYGISSFVTGGSVQPFWNSYHYILNALETQNSKVIVLDVNSANFKEDYSDHSRIIKNNFGLQFTQNKIDSLKASVPKSSSFMDYFLEFPTYHSRYNATDIDETDFIDSPTEDYYKGYSANFSTEVFEEPKNLEIKEEKALPIKSEEYLLKIIDLCEDREVPLVLIKTPHILSEEQAKIYNTVEKIASENNLPFINYNLISREINLDYSTDFSDANHLNYYGGIKTSKHLSDYLNTNYNLPDRRGEKELESYDVSVDVLEEIMLMNDLKIETDIAEFARLLFDISENNTIFIVVDGDYKSKPHYSKVVESFMKYGIDINLINENLIISKTRNDMVYIENSHNDFNWYDSIFTHQVLSISEEQGSSIPSFFINEIEYPCYENSISVFVYNNLLEEFVMMKQL